MKKIREKDLLIEKWIKKQQNNKIDPVKEELLEAVEKVVNNTYENFLTENLSKLLQNPEIIVNFLINLDFEKESLEKDFEDKNDFLVQIIICSTHYIINELFIDDYLPEREDLFGNINSEFSIFFDKIYWVKNNKKILLREKFKKFLHVFFDNSKKNFQILDILFSQLDYYKEFLPTNLSQKIIDFNDNFVVEKNEEESHIDEKNEERNNIDEKSRKLFNNIQKRWSELKINSTKYNIEKTCNDLLELAKGEKQDINKYDFIHFVLPFLYELSNLKSISLVSHKTINYFKEQYILYWIYLNNINLIREYWKDFFNDESFMEIVKTWNLNNSKISLVVEGNNYLDMLYILLIKTNLFIEKWTFVENDVKKLGLNIINSKFWVNISDKNLTTFNRSKVKYEIISLEWEKQIYIWKIVLNNLNFFNWEEKIRFEKLYNYLLTLEKSDIERINSLLLSKKINNYVEDEVLFLISNNLENLDFLNNNVLFKYLYELHLNWVNITLIKSIDTDSITYLKNTFSEDFEFISTFLKDCDEKNIDFVERQKNNDFLSKIKNDLFFLNKKSVYYKEIVEILNSNFWELDFIDLEKSIKKIYKKNSLLNIILKNKSRIWNRNIHVFMGILNDFSNIFSDYSEQEIDIFIDYLFKGNSLEDLTFIKDILNSISIENNLKLEEFQNYVTLMLKKKSFTKALLLFDNDFSLNDLVFKLSYNNELDYYKGNIIKVFWDNFDLWTNTVRLDIILKVWKLLNIDDKETFILLLDDKLSTEAIKNLYRILTFLDRYELNHWIFEKIIWISLDENKIDFLFSKFKSVTFDNIENKQVLLDKVLIFIEYWDESVINNYLNELKVINKIEFNNVLDKELFSLINWWDLEKIQNISKSIQELLEEILLKFNPNILSSTINDKTWSASGWYSKAFNHYFIRELEKRDSENDIEYLNRIKIVNWKSLLDIDSFSNYRRVINIINCAKDKNYPFFEALIKFSEIIEKLWESWKRDLVYLNNYYKNLLEDLLKLLSDKHFRIKT